MITFLNESNEKPLKILKENYEQALQLDQTMIQAISISSYCSRTQTVDSRYVNLKFINNDKFIFFTNYNSPKAKQFQEHEQISALIFWSRINLQIRFKAIIEKTSLEFNNTYFASRNSNKNALAISSNQSNPIESYEIIKDKFYATLETKKTNKCPKHWGGYAFTPYEIEFWKGNNFRLNRRDLFTKLDNTWNHCILEP